MALVQDDHFVFIKVNDDLFYDLIVIEQGKVFNFNGLSDDDLEEYRICYPPEIFNWCEV